MSGCVFINYRGVDSHSYGALLYTDLIRRFGEALVFLDAESIPAGEDYVRELMVRVRSARVVLAVIGPNWLTAADAAGERAIDDPGDWIRRELVEAFAAGVRVIPVLIDGAVLPVAPDLPGDIAALSRCQARYLRRREPIRDLDRLAGDLIAMDRELAAAEQAISVGGRRPVEVLNRVEGDVYGLLVQAGSVSGGLHVHLPSPTQDTEVSSTHHVQKLPVVSGMFVGRGDDLARLEEATGESDRAVVVVVYGLGGVGKSTLAARFAEQHRDEFSPVWWVTADSVEAIGAGLADLAVAINPAWAWLPAEQRTELAMGWLASHNGWLLILDNLTTPADAQFLLQRVQTGTVIITSRYSGGWRNITTLSLNVLSLADADELLDRIVRADWFDAILDGAEHLCEELGWLPLAIEQAGAYITQNRITPSRYLELLTEYPAQIFTATAEGRDTQRTMARIWHLTLDRLADTSMAGEVLRQLAWCGSDNIPRALLERSERGPDVGEALGRLAAYNMITLTVDAISIHRLVQAVARTPDPTDQYRQADDIAFARDNAAAGMVMTLDGLELREPTAWPIYQAVLPHARALLEHRWPHAHTPAVRQLRNMLDGHAEVLAAAVSENFVLISQGKAKEALASITAALPMLNATLDERDPLVHQGDYLRGMAHFQLAQFDEAIEVLEKSHRGQLATLGMAHPQTLRTQFEYAMALKLRDRDDDRQRANSLLHEVLQRTRSVADDRVDDLALQARVAAVLTRYAPSWLLRRAHGMNHKHKW